MKSLNSFPRVSLGVFPTPIQKLENISRMLNTNVYIKRDDLSGLGLGGKAPADDPDESGKAEITSEPWSEFFSANLLRDERAIANNLSYLPRTCVYFAETLAPKLLNYFKGLVAG